MKVNCILCGKECNRRPAHIKKSKNIFCSFECKSKWMKENLKGKNNPMYGKINPNKGIPRTDEVRKKISQCHKNNFKINPSYYIEKARKLGKANKGQERENLKGKNNPMYGRSDIARLGFLAMQKKQKTTKYMYKNILMRSTWEVKFAKILDKLELEWKYEDKLVSGNMGWYFPDFHLIKKDLFIEIKGYHSEVGIRKFLFWKKRRPDNFFMLDEPYFRGDKKHILKNCSSEKELMTILLSSDTYKYL